MLCEPGGRRPSSKSSAARSYGFCGAPNGASSTTSSSTTSAITEPLTDGRLRSCLRMARRRGVSASGAVGGREGCGVGMVGCARVYSDSCNCTRGSSAAYSMSTSMLIITKMKVTSIT